MNSGALLLDSKNQPLEAYPPELVELLAEGALSPDARRELDRLHRERKRVKCADGIIRHAVQRAYPFLRVNRGQERVERGGCALCMNSSANGTARGTFEIPESRGAIGAILATRLHPATGGDKRKPPKGRGGGVSRPRKYHKAFAVLWTILEQAGFTSLGGPLEWAELWGRVQAQLAAVLIHPESVHTFAHFAWMPGRLYKGGLVDLNRRLRDWDHRELQPEAWAFGIMDAPPVDGQVELYVLPSVARAAVASRGGQLYPPLRFEVPRSCVACVGRSGPYLTLAIGSLNNDGEPKFTKPNFHRLIMQAVANELSPVPVESQYEREVVSFFQRRRVGYHKPVFGNAEGLRPDFVLPNQSILVEVQGMNDKGYRDHKRVMHQRLTMSEAYAGYRLVTYEPNEGESIEEFERRLMSMMRPL